MRYAARLLAVREERAGSVAVVEAPVGSTVLFLEDVIDFDEIGGQLVHLAVDGTDRVYAYESTDVESDPRIVLSSSTSAVIEEDDPILVYPIVTELVAEVATDDATGPPVIARVPHAMRGRIPTGALDDVDQRPVSVRETDDGLWVVEDLRGLDPDELNVLQRAIGVPRFEYENQTGQTVAQGATETAQFDDANDTRNASDPGMYELAADAFVFPFQGLWHVDVWTRWGGASAGRRHFVEISANEGGAWSSLGIEHHVATGFAGTGLNVNLHSSAGLFMNDGEWMRVRVDHTVTGTSDLQMWGVWAHYLGPRMDHR